MKTFEEVKNEQITRIAKLIQKKEENLNDSVDYKWLNILKNNLENIDELTEAIIGVYTRGIIKDMNYLQRTDINGYYNHFQEKINNSIALQPTKDGLGMTLEDFKVFEGQNLMSNVAADLFKKNVNANFGTNIPSSSEEAQIKQAFKDMNVLDVDSWTKEDAQTYVDFREMSNALGETINGGMLESVLADDEKYVYAKSMCNSRSK